MKVAFIGLGIMGSRMALNLLKSGAELSVWNRTASAADELVRAGATRADTAAEAVREADLVFSMLSTPSVVEAVFLGREGALRAMPKASLWADCSTVDPSFSRRCAVAASEQGVRFVDAPVAGTKPHAAGAQLSFFVGGSEEDFQAVKPLAETMGAKVLYLGEVGQGASFKMLVNSMLAQSMLVFSETVVLGQRLGLDREFLLKVLPTLVVSAPVTQAKANMIRKGDYDVMFPLEWMHKDLHLAAVAAYEVQQPLPMANTAKEIYAEALRAGMGRLDFAAIHKYLEEK